jgi:hypothetical protein
MTQMDPAEQRLRRAILGVSLVLFLAGAALPALTFTGVAGSASGQSLTYVGIACLFLGPINLVLFGPVGDFMLGVAWLANPFLFAAWWLVGRAGRPGRMAVLSAVGVALALLPLLTLQLPTKVYVCCETVYETRLTAIGLGYLAWASSAVSVVVGAFAIARNRAH